MTSSGPAQVVSVFAQLQSGRRLPSPKGVVLRLIELAQQEEASLVQVTRLVQADPSLAGRIVRAANSVASAPARPVVATGDAILRLGLPSVFQLALGFSLVSQYRGGECRGFDYNRYWSHSLLQAVAARAVAMRMRVLPPEEGFVCGLLARVGVLGLATAWPERYGEVASAPEGELVERERAAFEISHVELTSCLLAHWGFPRPLAEGILAHESPESAMGERTGRIAGLLRLAARIADIGCSEPATRPAERSRARRAAEPLGFSPDILETLLTECEEAWRAWSPVFELDPAGASFEDLAAPAAKTAAVAPTEARGLRLLVSDGDPVAARHLAAILADAGHDVRIGLGTNVLSKLVDAGYDGALLDWDARGRAACQALRNTVAGRRLHVIAIGNERDEGALERAVAAGADDYIAKPYAPRLLEARLTALGRTARVLRDHERDLETLKRLSSDLASRNRTLQVAASRDDATGLPRGEAALAAIGKILERGERVACLLVDIDDLKPLNERHGRLAGDRVLVHVAGLLKTRIPPGADVARFGGDEFLVHLPGHDAPRARHTAELLAACIAKSPLALRGDSVALSVSIGVAATGGTAREIVSSAYEAACAARRLGGNRTCVADGSGARAA